MEFHETVYEGRPLLQC